MPRTDLMHPQSCLNASLRKATRVAMQLYLETMRDTKLEGTQFTLLAAINGFRTCTMGELAGWLRMDQTTVTRSVDLLARAGLVTVSRGREDRRTRSLTLSAAGQQRLTEALPHWRSAQRKTVERFGVEKARQLLTLLDQFSALEEAGEGIARK